jgi:RNA polymerase sigma-70 factor (ECF subfamily)
VEGADFASALQAAQEGDEQGFVTLFRSVQPALLRYLRTVGGAMADDVAADAWVSVVRNLHKFRGDERGWQAWVFTIARARLRDEQRRAVRRAVPVDVDDQLASLPDPCDVLDEVETIMTTESALALIARLPTEQAEIVMLRHVVGLDVEHTARIVGKRPGTVRVAAHRGLKRLATMLDGRVGGLVPPGAVVVGNASKSSNDR